MWGLEVGQRVDRHHVVPVELDPVVTGDDHLLQLLTGEYPVVSKNTNELKTGAPGRPLTSLRRGLDAVVLRKKSIQRYAIFFFADHRSSAW